MSKLKFILLCFPLWGLFSCQESFDDRCAREAREYTEKQCPHRMDEYTVMDSLTYDRQTRTLNYYYTLEGALDNDSVMTDQACEELKKMLHKDVINSVGLKSYKEKDINFRHCYYSKSSGKIRFQVRFTPEDY